jgi:hypothetical protein
MHARAYKEKIEEKRREEKRREEKRRDHKQSFSSSFVVLSFFLSCDCAICKHDRYPDTTAPDVFYITDILSPLLFLSLCLSLSFFLSV